MKEEKLLGSGTSKKESENTMTWEGDHVVGPGSLLDWKGNKLWTSKCQLPAPTAQSLQLRRLLAYGSHFGILALEVLSISVPCCCRQTSTQRLKR